MTVGMSKETIPTTVTAITIYASPQDILAEGLFLIFFRPFCVERDGYQLLGKRWVLLPHVFKQKGFIEFFNPLLVLCFVFAIKFHIFDVNFITGGRSDIVLETDAYSISHETQLSRRNRKIAVDRETRSF